MVDTNKLRGVIAENGKTQTEVAKMIGITPKTFYMRMHKKEFGSNEIQIMIDNLNITNPMEIFFAKEVT
jgi:DNA-binding XRE family transcriptional regulator